MPLSKEEKKIIITKLQERCDYTLITPYLVPAEESTSIVEKAEYNGELEGRMVFYKLVEREITDIVSRGLNRGVVGWGIRCKDIREQKKHTPQEAADIIGISRRSLQNEENKIEAITVDPFYLEVFSLLYNESPYTLLGLNPPLIDPLRTVDDTLSMYMNAIITSLYVEDDPEKIEYLGVIAKVATLSDDMQRKLVDFLKCNTKLFADVFRQDVLKLPAAHDNSWRGKMTDRVFIQDTSPTAKERCNMYTSLLRALNHLENRRSPRLKELAQLSALDGTMGQKVRKVVYALIALAEFPRVEKALRSDIDSCFNP